MNTEKHLDNTALKRNYLTVLAVFASDEKTTSNHLNGIRTWGQQLDIPDAELQAVIEAPQKFIDQKPRNAQNAIEQLYDLVYMIYLDKVVDDHEIEIMMQYAEHLGFPQHIIGDLIKAILTAPSDGISTWQVKSELKELLEASLG